MVKLLLATGNVDVDTKGGFYGKTPLSWAAGEGHEAVVRLLQSKVQLPCRTSHLSIPFSFFYVIILRGSKGGSQI